MSATNDQLIFELCADPNYRVALDGTITTLIQVNGKLGTRWRVMNSLHEDGYVRIRYRRAKLFAHRIVWAKFMGYLRAEMEVNHIDGVKTNNAFDNLELVSKSRNQYHAYATLDRPINRGNAKLSWELVDAIRADRRAGFTLKKLKEKYFLPKSTLSQIINFRTYKEELRHGAN